MIDLTWLAALLGLIGLAVAIAISFSGAADSRNAAANESSPVGAEGGAAAFLARSYALLGAFTVILAGLLAYAVNTYAAAALVLGVVLSVVASSFGVRVAVKANARMANASRQDPLGAGADAMNGAASIGLAVVSLGIIGLGTLYYLMVHRPGAFTQVELLEFAAVISAFGLGVSAAALTTRLGSGIFSGAAEARDHLDPRHAAAVPITDRNASPAGRVGHTLTDVAGFGAEILELVVSTTVAAVVLAVTGGAFSTQRGEAIALPILAVAGGLLTSLIVLAALRTMRGIAPARALRGASLIAAAIFLVLAYLIVAGLAFEGRDSITGRTYLPSGPYWAIFGGTLLGLLLSFAAEYYTTWRPLRRVARESEAGPAATLLSGLAVGLESTVLPPVLISVAIAVAYFFAGMYGIGLAAVGLASTLAVPLAVEVYGSITEGVRGVADGKGAAAGKASGESVELLGGSARSIGRGFSSAASALVALALLAAFTSAVGLSELGIHLISPLVLVGLLIGGVLPYLVAALSLGAINRTAGKTQVGAAESGEGPAGLFTIHVRGALLGTAVPLTAVVAMTLLVGSLLGLGAMAGVVAGAILSGTLLSLFLANGGGALQNADAYLGSPGSLRKGDEARSSAAGAVLGAILSGACSPAVASVIKFIAILCLAFAPWLAELWVAADPPTVGEVLALADPAFRGPSQ